MNRQHKVISLSQDLLTFFQAKEGASFAFKQVPLQGLSEQELSKTIVPIAKMFHARGNQALVVVKRQDVSLRVMVLPSKDKLELKKMVALQLPSIVPFNTEESVFDVCILGDAGQGQSKVLVAIVPKDVVEKSWRALVVAGIIPRAFVLDALCIWSWYAARSRNHQGVSLVVDLNAAEVNILVCSTESMLACRSLRISNPVDWTISVTPLVREIDLTMEKFVQDRMGVVPGRIVVTGSVRVSNSFLAALKEEYGLPVEEWTLPKGCPSSRESQVALLGASMDEAALRINLMPEGLRNEYYKAKARTGLLRMGGAAFCVVIMGVVLCAMHGMRKRDYWGAIDAQWAGVKKKLDSMELSHKRIGEISQVLNSRISVAEVYAAVTNAAPRGISLFNLSFASQRSLVMQGVANNSSDITIFQEGLTQSGLFENIRLDFVNKRATQEMEQSYFKLSCQIK